MVFCVLAHERSFETCAGPAWHGTIAGAERLQRDLRLKDPAPDRVVRGIAVTPTASQEGAMQRDLVERAQGGDHEAFEALTAAAFDKLYMVAYRILRDADRSEDAIQECLVRAWRDMRGLRDPDRFDGWLYRLLVNACRDEGRRLRRGGANVRLLVPEHQAAPGDPFESVADRDQLERGFRRLTIEQRSVLVLHYYLGMRPAEIAETLGVPVGTIHSRLHYATTAMRAGLEADARAALVATGGRTA
jgi:RNA polymerase sigma-70 factor (ECF subfamily)